MFGFNDLRRPTADHRGQTLVEAALILPIILMVLLLTIDLGRAYFAHVALRNAAREAAIYGGYNPDESCATGASHKGLRYAVAKELQLSSWTDVGCGSGAIQIVVTGSNATGCFQYSAYTACPAGTLNPAATYIFRVDLLGEFEPVVPLVGLLTGNGLGNPLPLRAVTSSPVLSGYGS